MSNNKQTTIPIRYAEDGSVHVDIAATLATHNQDIQRQLMLNSDMARLGIGDLPNQATEPGARYYDTYNMGRARPMEKPVARMPRPIGKLPPEAEKLRPLVEDVMVPALEKVLKENREKAQCQTYFTQPTTWLAPPVTAISIDIFTQSRGVVIPGGGNPQPIVSIDVPDRFVVVLQSFGYELEDHLAFGNIRMSMQRNKVPIRSYGDFDVQLGRFVDPTKLGAPIILANKERFRLQARSTDSNEHTVFARFIGWAFAVKATGDGTYTEYHTL